MTTLGRICAACGVQRKIKSLLYDPSTFAPYCQSAYLCNDAHPNSPKNLILNQRETELISYSDANDAYKKHLISGLQMNEDHVGQVQRLLRNPATLRIQDPKQAEFLVEMMVGMGFTSVSESIRHCIHLVHESQGTMYKEHVQLRVEKERSEKVAEVVKAIETPLPAAVPEEEEGGLMF